MDYLIFHPALMIVGVIFIFTIALLLSTIYDKTTNTYNGVYYGGARRSKSEYKLIGVEITRIKTVRITIEETFGKRTVSGYSQYKGVKSANLSSWETKIKTYVKSIPLSDCTLEALKRRPDEDISFLAEQIAKAVQDKFGIPEETTPIIVKEISPPKAELSSKERNRIEELAYKFWRDADNLIEKYSEEKSAESIYELMINIWQTRDKGESAVQLHFCTLNAIKHLYPLRDINESVIDMTLDLCELDIANFENLKKEMDITSCSLITPNKKAVILEKKGLYLEALEFSEWCHSQGICEERDRTFEGRIERLKKKVNVR